MVKNYNCLGKRTQGIGKCLVGNEVLGKVALSPAPRSSQLRFVPTVPRLLRVVGCLQIRHDIVFCLRTIICFVLKHLIFLFQNNHEI